MVRAAARQRADVIASVEQSPAPLRIALGTDSFGIIRTSLTDRLAALEAQQDVAVSTDFPADE